MATVHLICGSTGAGKTTYAAALAGRVRGVLFSIDQWMATLYLPDRPDPMSLDWAIERTARCELQIWTVVDQLVARGLDVILDVGLSRREHRDRFRQRALEIGAECKLHYLDVDLETRRARVRERNVTRAGSYSLEVTDAMFDWMEQWFEAPSDDELYEAMIVCS